MVLDDHVVAVEQPGLELVDGPLAQLDVADEVPRAGGDEPGRDHAPRVARLEHVAGDLLADEPAVRQVVVEASGSHSRDTARRDRGACPCRSRGCRRSGRRRASAGPTARRNAGLASSRSTSVS